MKRLTRSRVIADPPIATFLFNNTRLAVVWLLVRLYVGYAWYDAGLHKLQDPAWMETGKALQAFWTRAAAVPAPPARPAVTYDWYRAFLQFLLENETHTWFAKFVAVGEFLIGVALILGILTGFAAVAGGFMNMNFLLAGTASVNPVLLLFAILLILAWKTAGYIGVDHWLLPLLGTPWKAPSERTGTRLAAPGAVVR